jgi:tetratricopeptide (TPR) repeat protein
MSYDGHLLVKLSTLTLCSLMILSYSHTILALDNVTNNTLSVPDIPSSFPNNTLSLVERGMTLYNESNYDEAIVWFDKALALDSNNIDALINKGRALFRLDRPDEAIVWFDKALEMDPNNKIALNGKVFHLSS